MTTARLYVANAYPGKEWRTRVNRMSERQVQAIYISLKKREGKTKAAEERGEQQLTFNDIMEGVLK